MIATLFDMAIIFLLTILVACPAGLAVFRTLRDTRARRRDDAAGSLID